jgi:hypothetical protein
MKDANYLLGLDWISLYTLRILRNDPSRIWELWGNGARVVENYGADARGRIPGRPTPYDLNKLNCTTVEMGGACWAGTI